MLCLSVCLSVCLIMGGEFHAVKPLSPKTRSFFMAAAAP